MEPRTPPSSLYPIKRNSIKTATPETSEMSRTGLDEDEEVDKDNHEMLTINAALGGSIAHRHVRKISSLPIRVESLTQVHDALTYVCRNLQEDLRLRDIGEIDPEKMVVIDANFSNLEAFPGITAKEIHKHRLIKAHLPYHQAQPFLHPELR